MDIIVVALKMIQLFIIITVGYIIGKTALFKDSFNQDLTTLVLNLTMPCLILGSVMNSSSNTTLALKDLIIATIILVGILPLMAFLLIKILPFKEHLGLYLFMIMYPNVGFMGFPLMKAIFNEAAVLSTAIINMGFNLSLFTVGVAAINYGRSFKIELKKLLSPGVIASLLAILIYSLKLSFPKMIVDSINSIGDMTTPLAMLIIGATLSKYHLKDVFNDYRVYLFTILIDLILPAVLYPVLSLFIENFMIKGIALIILAMPVANGAVLFAKSYEQDEFLAAKTVFISTLLGIFTIPIIVYLFLN